MAIDEVPAQTGFPNQPNRGMAEGVKIAFVVIFLVLAALVAGEFEPVLHYSPRNTSRTVGQPVRDRQGNQPLRTGHDGAQSRAQHAQVLQERVHRTHRQ